MAHKVRNPGAGRRQGFAVEVVSDANLDREHSPFPALRQDLPDPVAIIAARARVALPTARLHAELFGIGGARHA